MNHPRKKFRAGTLAAYAVLVVGAVVTLAPFALALLTAFKSPAEFAANGPLALPSSPTMENFTQLFTGTYGFLTPIAVTAQVVLVVTVFQILFSVFAAYAFAKMEFTGRDALFWVYLAMLMVPQIVTLVPLYTMFSAAGLRNTFWGIVLPVVFGSPYAVFLLREFFRGIPDDIISAAKLDGASTMRIILSVVAPMSRPILATLAIITVVTHWNNFLWPLMITSDKTWQTMTVATANLQSQYDGNWTLVMAATCLAILPLLGLYLVFQKHIVNSIAIGGVK